MIFLVRLNHKLVSFETFSGRILFSWIVWYSNFKLLHSNWKCAKRVKISGCRMDCSTSYEVYISYLIRFARVSSHVVDFNARNKSLTAKLLQQGYRYHKLRKTFSKFYRRHYELVSKFSVRLKTLLHQGLSEPEFYGDLVYKFKNKNCR